ncbi:hypothetical protein DAPPUDRAFT_53673 [Daphnia pulex]|uniref:Uncharacterized protein n=1 Tax=Daphnia pulex TaxID=6669 RepID=E9GR86_DAPPU|nr:hypothetical protein DAPPUDRAFT_67250 [Daphnia pulex]EFX77967.1 hypothetical protein DAPPUDRAFT_53673 [Daphnia pulex]|eukprot:EFX63231.1 hypothetical protein DAPPUDRAFT_67250 [Daphnia pulex]
MAHVCRCSSLWLSVCRWGQDGVSCLNYVERYDPKENKWSKVASMNTRRLVVAVAVLGGYVRSIEVYDPEQNQWRLCVTMNYRRLGGGMVLVKCLKTHLW